jgi:hypothetical protein
MTIKQWLRSRIERWLGIETMSPARWVDKNGNGWCVCGHGTHADECAVKNCPCLTVRTYQDRMEAELRTLRTQRDAALHFLVEFLGVELELTEAAETIVNRCAHAERAEQEARNALAAPPEVTLVDIVADLVASSNRADDERDAERERADKNHQVALHAIGALTDKNDQHAALNDEALRWTEIAGQQAEQIGQLTDDVETAREYAQDNHREALRAIGALESARGQARDFERQRDAWKAVLGVGPGDIDTTPIQALAAFSSGTPELVADREALIRRFAEWYRVYWGYDTLNDSVRDQAHEVYAMLVGTGTLPFSGQWQALTVEQIQAGAIAIRERLHSDPATRREVTIDVARAFGLIVPSEQVPGE